MAKKMASRFDVEYWGTAKKRPIAGSTKTTSDFLAAVHELHPTLTIAELKALITDKTKYIPNYEAIAVLDAYIRANKGNEVLKFG